MMIEGRWVWLDNPQPDDFDFLYGLAKQHADRFGRGGAELTEEEFAHSFMAGVLSHGVVRSKANKPLGLCTAYGPDIAGMTVYLEIAKNDLGSLAPFIEGVGLFIDRLFEIGFRKVYIEATEENAAQFLPWVDRLGIELVEEGRKRFHVKQGDGHVDLVLWALWRESWNLSEAKRLLSEGKVNVEA